jgi:hypothetical protein
MVSKVVRYGEPIMIQVSVRTWENPVAHGWRGEWPENGHKRDAGGTVNQVEESDIE